MLQPKQLTFKDLKPQDEFHPGGFLCKIIDNDGHTVLKEWWDNYKPNAILTCRNWLKMKYEGNIDYSYYEGVLNANTANLGQTLDECSNIDLKTVKGSNDTSGCGFSNS
jgi:hypothetical protein